MLLSVARHRRFYEDICILFLFFQLDNNLNLSLFLHVFLYSFYTNSNLDQ